MVMENSKVFRFINRLNSILFLVMLVSVIGFTAFTFAEMNRGINVRTVAIESPDKSTDKREVIELSEVDQVYGHDYQMIMAYSRRDGVLGSGGYSRTVRNILFLDPQGNDPKWLLETNEQVVTESIQLSHEEDEYDSITDYHYFCIVSDDTNGDGLLSAEDKADLFISSPSGADVAVLANDLDRIINHQYNADNRSLSLLAQVGNKIVYRIYSLETLKLLSEKFVTQVV
jgi:hypothetical protein